MAGKQKLRRSSRVKTRGDLAALRPAQRDARGRSLDAIRLMRRDGHSLIRAAREAGTTPRTVRRYADGALERSSRGRFKARPGDRLLRVMNVLSTDGHVTAVVRGARSASLVAEHANTVKRYLETGDTTLLDPFVGKRVAGLTLETDPDAIETFAPGESVGASPIARWPLVSASTAVGILNPVGPTEHAARHRDRAKRLVAGLLPETPIDAALLFGSSARGDAQSTSDVDLLLVFRDRQALSGLRQELGRRRRSGELRQFSIVGHTWSTLDELGRDDWSFARHLRDEGIVLQGERELLLNRLSRPRPTKGAISDEMRTRLATLDRYGDLTRFSGDYFFPLLSIYVVSKQLIMLACLSVGHQEFRRSSAFSAAQQLFPRCDDAVAHLQSLEPYYRASNGSKGADTALPCNDRSLVKVSCEAVRQLVQEAT